MGAKLNVSRVSETSRWLNFVEKWTFLLNSDEYCGLRHAAFAISWLMAG
jgi:hypothetical protein